MQNINELTTPNWQRKRNSLGEVVTENEDIEQCFETIISTIKGECPLQPNIGCNIFEAIGEDPKNATQIIQTIIFKEFPIQEPRAKIISVRTYSNENDYFKLTAEVKWQNIHTKEVKVSKFNI